MVELLPSIVKTVGPTESASLGGSDSPETAGSLVTFTKAVLWGGSGVALFTQEETEAQSSGAPPTVTARREEPVVEAARVGAT